jgi:hypothetical protein
LVLAAVLLVIVGLPAWAPFLKLAKGDIWISPIWTWRRLLFFGTFASVYMYLAYDLARVVQTGRTKGGHQLWLLGGVSALLPAIFVWLLVVLWMPGREIELFQLRTRVFGSGLSPLIPLSLVTGALFVWILCEVQRLGLVQRQGPDRPLDLLCETSVKSCGDFVQRLHAWMDQTFPRKRWIWVLLPGVLVPPLVLLWGTVQPISETKAYGRIFLVLLVVAWFLVLMSFLRFFSIWLSLRSILQRLNYVSPDLKKAFEKLSGEIEWNPMRSFAFNLPRFKMLDLSVRRFKSLVSARRIEDSLPGVEARLEKIFQSEAEGFTLDEARHRRELDETFHDACKSLAQQVQTPDVREFVALRIVVYLRYVFGHLRSSLMGAVGSGLLVLLAVAAFVFQPKQFVSLAIWVTLAVSVMVTFWVFLQMDRNPTLSRIGGTKPGEVTFDKAFWANFTLYVIVPVLSMIATQSPEVGRLLGRMADQFLRVAGSG